MLLCLISGLVDMLAEILNVNKYTWREVIVSHIDALPTTTISE